MQFLHGCHRIHGIFLQHIRCCDRAQESTLLRTEIQGRFSRLGKLRIGRNGDILLDHQLFVAAKVADTVNDAADTAAGDGSKFLHRTQF